MTLKRTAAALAIVVGLLILVGSFGDSSVTFNNREIEGPLKALIAGAGVLIALVVGGLVVTGAGVLVTGILAFIGVILLLAFAPILVPFLLIAFLIYWFARRKSPSVHSRPQN